MKKSYFLLLLLLVLGMGPLKSQTLSPDSLLNNLIGNWVLKGTIDGQQTIHDVDIQRVLGGQYIQIKETSSEKDEKGNPQYEALVYLCWEASKNQYSCLWLDNTGNGGISNGITGIAKPGNDKIELIFRYNETFTFHTTFIYERKADSWQWLMDSDDNGKTEPFARLSMNRKK